MSNAFTGLRDGIRQLFVTAGAGKNYSIPAADNEPERCTYGGGILGFTLAATPTDILTIQGAANKIVRIKSIIINGNSLSLAAYPISLIRRSTVHTGGTSTVITAGKHDTSDPNSAAVLRYFTANPTPGTTVATLHIGRVIAASASNLDRLPFQYAWQNDKAILLNGASEFLAINMGATALAGATTMDIDVLWTEEDLT